jgi:hypothetical protein
MIQLPSAVIIAVLNTCPLQRPRSRQSWRMHVLLAKQPCYQPLEER